MNENVSFQNRNDLQFSQNSDEQLDIRALVFSLYANKWLIVIVMALCLLLAISFVALKPAQYTANVLLQVEQGQNNGITSIEKSFNSMGVEQASLADVQSVLIKSRYILAPVVQQLGLDLVVTPDYFPFFGKSYAAHHSEHLAKPLLGLSHYAWGGESLTINQFIVPISQEKRHFTLVVGAGNDYLLYDANGQIILHGKVGEQAVAVIPGQGTYSIMIHSLQANAGTHFDIYKKSTQQIINGLADKLEIADLGQMKQFSKTGVLSISLTDHDPVYVVSVLDEVARVSIQKDIEKKTEEATKTLTFLNDQLPIVKQSLDQAETALNNYRAKTGTMDLEQASTTLLGQITSTQKELSQAEVEKAMALQKYTPSHPYVLAMDDKVKALQAELASEELQMSKLPSKDQAAISLMRDVRVKSQLYLILLNKIQSLQVAKAGTISDVRILALAEMPEAPIPLPKALIFLASLIVGFIIGTMIVLARHAFHKKISDPAQVESQLGLTNLAIVPHSQVQADIIATHNPKVTLLPLLAKSKPKDLSIEALRSLRTSLKFAMLEAKNNVITIMGVAPGVGKSFISANFAYLLADAGQKILLIDGDIRKGHLKDYFKVGSCKGLSDVIAGDCSFEQALIKGPIENLDFLATGAYPPNPSELLMSQRFQALIEMASKQYDLVIIDTAPILAVTDAAVIGHHAATNFIVLASGAHEIGEVELALKRFAANGITLNGVVFNFSKVQSGLYRYSSNYTYNYQYKYE